MHRVGPLNDEAPHRQVARPAPGIIRRSSDSLPAPIPEGHVGPVVLPGSGRLIWWTGRVAIGLRHQPDPLRQPVGESALWVQQLVLDRGTERHAVA
jgi:hypothetical protein